MLADDTTIVKSREDAYVKNIDDLEYMGRRFSMIKLTVYVV